MVTNNRVTFNFKGYEAMITKLKSLTQLIILTVLFLTSTFTYAVSLNDVSFASMSGGRVQVKLVLSEALPAGPLNFTIDNPARIVIDLPNTTLNAIERTRTIGLGMANSLNVVEAGGRVRVVVNLTRLVSYNIDVEDDVIILNLDNAINGSVLASTTGSSAKSIEGIDFRRGDSGEGKVIIQLSDPSIPIDMSTDAGKIVINFFDTQLPSNLDRKLDVVDFATPVKEIDTVANGNNVKMTITAISDDYVHLAYQAGNQYTIEFKPVTEEEKEAKKKELFGYTGERLSLNFQSIEVRAVLQLIADFTGLNMVTSDTVGGNVTLRLKNVPWDQALDIILTSRGLGMRKLGNVIIVAPTEELALRERQELEANRQIEELAPLLTEFVQINYADASDLMSLIQAEENNLLSSRGNASVDARTNTLIVQDIASSLRAVKALISELDVSVRQVLIESRIVNADESFAKDIGVRFGYSKNTKQSGESRATIGDDGNAQVLIGGGKPGITNFGGGTSFVTGTEENFIVDLPALPADATSLALAIGKVGSYLLQLELSALIAEGRGEDIASPRVITSNQNEAIIASGVQVPFQEASSSGATTVAFKDAVLSLRVTPQITPDDRIIMDLEVNQDTISGTTVLGVPAINTRSVQTQVLVQNGETVVLGGVYSSADRKSISRTPFFGDLPYVGFLFKRTDIDRTKSELLIFITPKILKDSLNIQ